MYNFGRCQNRYLLRIKTATPAMSQNKYLLRIINSDLHWEPKAVVKIGIFLRIINSDSWQRSKIILLEAKIET